MAKGLFPKGGVQTCVCTHTNLFHNGHVGPCMMAGCGCARFDPQKVDPTTVAIPRETVDEIVRVLRFVSQGKGHVGYDVYPDATARKALAALVELGVT